MKWRLFSNVVLIVALTASIVNAQGAKTVKLLSESKLEIQRHVHAAAFSPDGKILAIGEDNIHLFDVTQIPPKEIGVLNARVVFAIDAIAFSADGKYVVFGGGDHSVRVWNLAEQKETFLSKDHKGRILDIEFSPDSKMVASAGEDKTTILWDFDADGKLTERSVIKAQDDHADAVKALGFSKNGKTLITAGGAGYFRFFNIAAKTVKQTGSFKVPAGFFGVGIRSSPSGSMWAVIDHKQVQLINSSGAVISALEAHKADVADVAFAADGKLIASADREGTLHVWTLGVRGPRLTKDRPGHFTRVAFAPQEKDRAGESMLAATMDDGTVFVMRIGTK